MSEVRLYLGKRGSGKTYRLSQDLKGERRVIVWDLLRERAYEKYQALESFDDLCTVLGENTTVLRARYSPTGDVPIQQDFDRVCEAVLESRGFVFAVEEIDLVSSPRRMPHPLERIVSIGRHYDLSLYAASRRPHAIHPHIRAQAHQITTFIQTEPRDIKWLQEVMGERALGVPRLGRFKSIDWRDDSPTTKGGDVLV